MKKTALTLLLILLSLGQAWAQDGPAFSLSSELGWRYSGGAKGGGVLLGVNGDIYLGPVLLGFQSQATNDHTMKKAKRVAGRVTSWLNLGARIPLPEEVALVVAAGVGGGWIHKPDDKAHFDSRAIHELVRFQVVPDEQLMIQIGIELQQHWQDGVIGPMDFSFAFVLGTGVIF